MIESVDFNRLSSSLNAWWWQSLEWNVYQFNSMARSGSEMPDTFFTRWVRVWVIGTKHFTERSPDLVLAASFFAVVAIFMQCESIVAGTHVRTDCVAAFLLASSVIHGTLVFIWSATIKRDFLYPAQNSLKWSLQACLSLRYRDVREPKYIISIELVLSWTRFSSRELKDPKEFSKNFVVEIASFTITM